MRMSGFWTATNAAQKKFSEIGFVPVRALPPNANFFDGGEIQEGFRKVQSGNPAREAIVGIDSEPDYWIAGSRNPYYG